ncbi:Flp pilus assembly protein, ATPase CpaE [Moorella thermoacetica Y72]|uniref:Flp pilus assembly protein, ATPase CpaE n=1 Tax=Moorella thermoacetica Y72 TaxID=1325331 RepID=A0A0S6U6S6_NEOTH|nr:AAA family ATPase [Moorella thermoacetica]GAF24698.1 Flp pilus assembly protein, ATPase CpaE [Moorella thermoacetica Y72]
MDGLEEKVKHMAEYLDAEAIASALKIPVETVQDILDGKALVQEVASSPQSPPVVQISSARVAYRQRVIAVWRAKGGVGATSVALGLAWLLKDLMRVLLVDCSFEAGVSDISFVLNLPEYPHIKAFDYGGIAGAVINVEPTLDVLQAPRNRSEIDELPRDVFARAVNSARASYDVIICDLPNMEGLPVQGVLENANTLLLVTGGEDGEKSRMLARLAGVDLNGKEVFLLCNRNSEGGGPIAEVLPFREFAVSADPELARGLRRGQVFPANGLFMRALMEVRNAMYESSAARKGGILRRLFGRG